MAKITTISSFWIYGVEYKYINNGVDMTKNDIANLKTKLLKNRDEWKFVSPFGWDKANVISRDQDTGEVITRDNSLYLGFNAKNIPLTAQERKILKSGLDDSPYAENNIIDSVLIGDKVHRPPIAFKVSSSQSVWSEKDRARFDGLKEGLLSQFLDQWERNAISKLPKVDLSNLNTQGEPANDSLINVRRNKLR